MRMTTAQTKFWDNFEKTDEKKSKKPVANDFKAYAGDYLVYNNDRWLPGRLYDWAAELDKNFKPTKIPV